MSRHICWRLIGMLLVSLMVGCTWNTYKATSGSGDPTAPRAVFKPEKNVAISDIDGQTVFATARNWWVPVVTKTRASVIPGKHTLTIKYAQTGWSSLGCRLTIDAQAGKTYVVKGKRLPAGDAAGFTAVKKPRAIKVVVWIEDADTGAGVVGETACQPIT